MQDLPTPNSFENTQSAESKYSIKLKQIIEEFGLTVYYGPEGYENIWRTVERIGRRNVTYDLSGS